MMLKSFSKINLTLNVNKKLSSNLHNLQSIFCIVNLSDDIEIKKISGNKDIIKFKGEFSNFINKRINSISKTLNLLRKEKKIQSFYRIIVNKKIPVFAGLGGGTSNAVFLTKKIINGKIGKKANEQLEKKIGSDYNLFFYKQGFLKNLKKITNFRRKYILYFLLVYPNIKCSSKSVYSSLKKWSPKVDYNFNKINSNQKFIKFLQNKKNDLQSVVEKKHPIIKKLILEIGKTRGCFFSRMTGSGSVCYGVFQSEKNAKKAFKKLRKRYPKFWLSIAKTI